MKILVCSLFFLFRSWYIFEGHRQNRGFNRERFLDAQCKSEIFSYLEFQALIYSWQYISDSFRQACATAAPGFVGANLSPLLEHMLMMDYSARALNGATAYFVKCSLNKGYQQTEPVSSEFQSMTTFSAHAEPR